MTVRFYDEVPDSALRFAVIVSRSYGKWVYCRHRLRATWEVPGGHREAGESIRQTARRELCEETGATEFSLRRICAYGVTAAGEETLGMLYFADITAFGAPLIREIGEILLCEQPPSALTYPEIQPLLLARVKGVWL